MAVKEKCISLLDLGFLIWDWICWRQRQKMLLLILPQEKNILSNQMCLLLSNENRTIRVAVKKICLLWMCTHGKPTVNRQGCFGRGALWRLCSFISLIYLSLSLQKNPHHTIGASMCTTLHSDRISWFWFHSTILTPPGPPGVSREAKSSTEFEFDSLVR